MAILLAGICFLNIGNAWQDPQPTQVAPPDASKEAQAEPQDEDQVEDQQDELIEDAPMALIAGNMEDQFVQAQTQAVKSELNLLKDQLDLSDDWGGSIEDSLKEDIKRVAKAMSEKRENAAAFGFDTALDPTLRNAMWEKIEEALPDGKEEAFGEFKDMIIKLQRLNDETAVKGILVFLDNQLCLSQTQVDKLKQLYTNNWDSGFNEQVGTMVINGMVFGREPVDLVSGEQFEEILTEQQLEVFKELDQSSNLMMALQMGIMGDEQVNLESVRTQCDKALDLKLAEYEALVGLTEKQKKMLSVARKGAVSKVSKRISDVFDNNDDAMNMLGTDLETMEILLEPVVSQCTRQKAWQNTIAKVFDEEQLKKIEVREESRKEMAADQIVNYMLFSMMQMPDTNFGLTYEQHIKLADVVKEKFDGTHLNYFGVAVGIFKVSDEEFQEILSEDQWASFKPMLDSQRASFDEMMESSDDDEDDESDE